VIERKLVTTLNAECITDDNNPDGVTFALHQLDIEAGCKLIEFLEAHQHSEFIIGVKVRTQQIPSPVRYPECVHTRPGFSSTKHRKTVYLYQDVEVEGTTYKPREERIDVHK
jgi:hypothetical protein